MAKINLNEVVRGEAFDLKGDGVIDTIIIPNAKVTAFQDIEPYNGLGYDMVALPYAYQGHGGVDFQAPIGTPLRAYFDTNVVSSGYEKTMGNYMITSNGFRFLHLMGVPKIGFYKAGEVVAYSGDSGIEGQPHVHVDRKPNNIDILDAFKTGSMLIAEINANSHSSFDPNSGNFRAVREGKSVDNGVFRFEDKFIGNFAPNGNGFTLISDTKDLSGATWKATTTFNRIMNDEVE